MCTGVLSGSQNGEAFAEKRAVPVDAGEGKGVGLIADEFFLRFHQTLHQRLALGSGKEKRIFRGFPVGGQTVGAGDPVDLGLKLSYFFVQPLRITQKNDFAHFEFQLTTTELKGGLPCDSTARGLLRFAGPPEPARDNARRRDSKLPARDTIPAAPGSLERTTTLALDHGRRTRSLEDAETPADIPLVQARFC